MMFYTKTRLDGFYCVTRTKLNAFYVKADLFLSFTNQSGWFVLLLAGYPVITINDFFTFTCSYRPDEEELKS